MCGIAGIVRFDERPIPRARLNAMLSHLRHRGPDGEGITEPPRCAMVHARLSIIDPRGGQQPMHAPAHASHGALHLVFNGEVYNHRDLRTQLQKHGHVFRSHHSDSEVLLHGYRQWGDELPEHLDGMFAFAVYDEVERRLFLARDRAGKKPLYLRHSPDRREVCFASLVGTIVAGLPSGERPGTDREALLNYLRLGYTLGRSMVDGIEEVPAAHFVRIEADGRAEVSRYWQPPPISRHGTSRGAADALDGVLGAAVNKRLDADVDVGCFLSGGIDSSVVAAIAQRDLGRAGGAPLRTYSVTMPEAAYDETPHARAVARHIGARHTVLETRVDDAMEDLERLMAVAGEPTADSSLLPTYWLCKAARPFCKVALSGDGGDELFGGYDRYRAVRLLATHRRWMGLLPGWPFRGAHAKSRRTRFGRLIDAAKAGPDPARQYHAMIHLFTDAALAELMPGSFGDAATAAEPALPHWEPGDDPARGAMRWDSAHYLPFDLLRKVDRASMAVALEVRCPLLDTAVIELAGRLPTAALMPGGVPKGLLREVASRYLPGGIVRRPKMGFAVPMGSWLRSRLRDPLHAKLFDGRLGSIGLSTPVMRRMFDQHTAGQADHTHRLFALLQLSLWLAWLERPGAVGP